MLAVFASLGTQAVKLPRVFTYLGILLVSLTVSGPGLRNLYAEARPANPCADPQTQKAINACAEQGYQDADAALNAVYRQLMGRLGNERRAQLKAAQVAWLKFRDAHCRFDSAQYGEGSVVPTLYYGCVTTLTKARTEDLKKNLENLTAK
jgi:uncharacterized protein YecT (DUF1311 family)